MYKNLLNYIKRIEANFIEGHGGLNTCKSYKDIRAYKNNIYSQFR